MTQKCLFLQIGFTNPRRSGKHTGTYCKCTQHGAYTCCMLLLAASLLQYGFVTRLLQRPHGRPYPIVALCTHSRGGTVPLLKAQFNHSYYYMHRLAISSIHSIRKVLLSNPRMIPRCSPLRYAVRKFRASSSKNILFRGFSVIEKLPAIFADCISYCFYPVLETLIRNSRPVKSLILLSYENFTQSIYRAFKEVMHTFRFIALTFFTWELSLFYDQISGKGLRLFYRKWFFFRLTFSIIFDGIFQD